MVVVVAMKLSHEELAAKFNSNSGSTEGLDDHYIVPSPQPNSSK